MTFKIIKKRKEESGFYVDVTFMHGDDDIRENKVFGPMDETVFKLFCNALHRMQSVDDLDNSIERLILEEDSELNYDDIRRRYNSEPQTFTDEIPEDDIEQYLDPDIFDRIRTIEYKHPWCEYTDHLAEIYDFSATYVEDGRRYEVELSFE